MTVVESTRAIPSVTGYAASAASVSSDGSDERFVNGETTSRFGRKRARGMPCATMAESLALSSVPRGGERRLHARAQAVTEVATSATANAAPTDASRRRPLRSACAASPTSCRESVQEFTQPSSHCGCLIERHRSTEAAGTRSSAGDVNKTGNHLGTPSPCAVSSFRSARCSEPRS
jgi:hypothetical protein